MVSVNIFDGTILSTFPVLTLAKVLTGANTTFGAHLLSLLLKNYRHVKKVYCLVKPERSADGIVRAAIEPVYRSLRAQDVSFTPNDSIEGIFADTYIENLDLGDEVYRLLCENVTMIIDAASIGAFYDRMSREEDVEDRLLKSMYNIIQLSLDVATAFPAPLYHLVPSAVRYEAPGVVHEDEGYSSAKAHASALPAQTYEKLDSILISAYETYKARTYTLHMPQVTTLPIQTTTTENITAKILEYILDEARMKEDGKKGASVENT